MFDTDHFAHIFKSIQNSRKDQIKARDWVYNLYQMKKNINIQRC